MKMQVKVVVRPQRNNDALALLVPEPPSLSTQTLLGVEFPSYMEVDHLTESVSNQNAYAIDAMPSEPFRISFNFESHNHPVLNDTNKAIFTKFHNSYTSPDHHLGTRVTESMDKLDSEEKTLKKVLSLVSGMFSYGDKNDAFEFPTFFDTKTPGNCIDINTVLLSSLYCTDIPGAYMAGYYFPEVKNDSISDGMHCWISTNVNSKLAHWDVAQSLINDVEFPIEGLNPFGGARVAFSYGRGLKYLTKWGESRSISHFAKPHWIYPDMSVKEANIEVRLTNISEDITSSLVTPGSVEQLLTT